MPLNAKRWCDPKEPEDGYRLLVCRFRPRALAKEKETWNGWCPELGPSKELHADYYGKTGTPLDWETFRKRYVEEMQAAAPSEWIDELASMLAEGKTITLLCSQSCTDASHCHRTVLKGLIEKRAGKLEGLAVAAS